MGVSYGKRPDNSRLDRHRRLFRADRRRRPPCRAQGHEDAGLLPGEPRLQRLADRCSGFRRRHPRRNAGFAGRQGLPVRLRRHLVPVEKPLHHAVLLAPGAAVPPLPPHHYRRSLRRPLRRLDGRRLHGLCALVFHLQHGRHAEGGREAGQRRFGRRDHAERRRAGDDRHVSDLQLRGRPGFRGLYRLRPKFFHHCAQLPADPLGAARGRRIRRSPRSARSANALDGHSGRCRRFYHRHADRERIDRHRCPAAHPGGRRHGEGRTFLPHRHGLRQFRQAVLHDRLGAGRRDRGRDAAAARRSGAGRPRGRVRLRDARVAFSGSRRSHDRLRSRRQHVHRLGFHGGRRRALHPEFLPPLRQAARVGPALPLGRPFRRTGHDRDGACSSASTSAAFSRRSSLPRRSPRSWASACSAPSPGRAQTVGGRWPAWSSLQRSSFC